jgi:hypothetical protein
MSYGAGKERKKKLKKIEEINTSNVKEFLTLAADQYASDYSKFINNRASDRETIVDSNFLKAVANKNIEGAFSAFHNDVPTNISDIVRDIIRKETEVNYDKDVTDSVKEYFKTEQARNDFLNATKSGIRRILDSPIKMGLSRTVLQKYLNEVKSV